MGFFSKNEEKKLPELPKLTNLPRYDNSISINSIKKEVEREIPAREKEVSSSMSEYRREIGEEKPLFIQIDKYKEAVKNIDEIKARIDGAEKLLIDLEAIKNDEEKKLQEWKQEINEIKNKLLEIDKELFEL